MTDSNDKMRDTHENKGRRDYRGGNKGGKGFSRDNSHYAKKPKPATAVEPEEPPQKKSTIRLRLDAEDVVRDRANRLAASEADALAEADGIKILFEDNHILVAVKPRNIPSQADSSGDPDFLSELKKYLVKKYNKPGEAYLGLLHRLDRPTGGVMVFAKTSKAAGRLSEQIRAGEFEKRYAAVTVGKPNRTGLVEHYLLKDEQSNTVTLAPSTMEGVKRAASEISIVDEKGDLSLVSVKLLTGRTHQARVQLKALGSPIVGDYRYAGDKLVKCDHLALWAYKLVFTHPVSGDVMKFIAAPPSDEFPWSEFDTDALVDVVRPSAAD